MRFPTVSSRSTIKALSLAATMLFAACGGGGGGDDGPSPTATPAPTATPGTNANSAQVQSNQAGEVETAGGQKLTVEPGSVPDNQSGPATTTFSIETVNEPPAPLPANIDLQGLVAKFGPDGFNFQWPVTTTLPIPDSTTDLTGLQYLRYDPSTGEWAAYPGLGLSADAQGNVISASVTSYDLGYDALGKLNTDPSTAGASGDPQAKLGAECTSCDGAMRWNTAQCGAQSGAECHYYFVAKSYKPRAAWQKEMFESYNRMWYNRGNGCVWNAATEQFEGTGDGNCGTWRSGSEPPGDPAPQTIFPIMQGDWNLCVTKSQYVIPGGSLPIPGRWTYSQLVPVAITQASHNTCQTFSCWSNVVDITLPGNGTWEDPESQTSCPTNSAPSQAVGTGTFQATLTWVNTESANADIDLWLYGPNGLQVYYGNSSAGGFALDRDWRYQTGNAVENIYTTGEFASGEYRVVVDHWGGYLPMNYSVRILRNGVSTTYSGTLSSDNGNVEVARFNL